MTRLITRSRCPGLLKTYNYFFMNNNVVPGAGLEPARPQWPGDFKSPVSTNFTTRAKSGVQRARRIPRRTAIPTPEPPSFVGSDFDHSRQILFL